MVEPAETPDHPPLAGLRVVRDDGARLAGVVGTFDGRP